MFRYNGPRPGEKRSEEPTLKKRCKKRVADSGLAVHRTTKQRTRDGGNNRFSYLSVLFCTPIHVLPC